MKVWWWIFLFPFIFYLIYFSFQVDFPPEFDFKRNPSSTLARPLKCTINSVRFVCDYSIASGHIIVTITLNYINTFTPSISPNLNQMIISTEYVSPDEGFTHPLIEGLYGFDVAMTDSSGNSVKSSRFIRIRGSKLYYFRISHVIRNPQLDNLYIFTFCTNTKPVASFSNGGRIEL